MRHEVLAEAELAELCESSAAADRAFADAVIRLRWGRALETPVALERAHRRLKACAARHHAPVRSAIAEGSLRGAELRRLFEAESPPERDHFIEEVLGIAYPPLDEGAPARDSMSYAASGYAEIAYAFDVTSLSPSDTVLDLGAGMGKVLLLATLVWGASAVGVERDAGLLDAARAAAASLKVTVDFRAGDARHAPLPAAEVVFAFLPFSGEALRTVLERLSSQRQKARWLCSGPLAHDQCPAFVPVGAPCSWLQVHRFGGAASG